MATITYKPLSSLAPIELKYQYNKNESLKTNVLTYQDGFSFSTIEGLINYKDVALNKGTCFILSSSVELNTIFIEAENVSLGRLPGTIRVQPRTSQIYYLSHNTTSNTIKLNLEGSIFYLQPIPNTSNDVEIFIGDKYLQIDEQYPYTARLQPYTLDPESIHRQRFNVVFQNGVITFKTLTNSGYRYLALNNDNVLRATGLMLGDSIVADYVFRCEPLTLPNFSYGFIPQNPWITYYFDIEKGTFNNDLTINKNIETTRTNLLIDFPLKEAVETGTVNINIANLKTSLTPTGGPAPLDNSYSKDY